MKFSCEKYEIQQAVTIASRCTAPKSPIPALEGILIQAGSDVRVTGYDLKKGIYTNIPADVTEPGAVVINARLLGEIIRNLPDGVVTLEVGANMIAQIKCGMADYTIPASPADDYPELPSVDRQNQITLPQNTLGKMIRQTLFAVSDNESRPVYTGSLFEIENDTLTIVSVDGFRLAVRKETVESNDVEDCTFIVPGSALSDVEKLCADADEKLSVTVGTKHISFSIGDTVLVSRRLEGEFINYRRSVPTQFAIVTRVVRDELVKSVNRVSLVIDDKTKSPLRLSVEEGRIVVECSSSLGRAEDTCQVQNITGEKVTLGLNNRYLLDALRAAPDDTLLIGFNSATEPCVLSPTEGEAFFYMILPVRLPAGATA